MSNPKLTIKNPCDESWDDMKPNGNGRHCNSCNETVVNFSEMAKEEIQDYFKNLKGKKVCGYFNSSQVEVKRPKHHLFLIELYEKIEQKITIPYLKKIPLYCVVFCLFLVGCKSKNVRTTGEVAKNKPNKNESKEDNFESTTGMPLMPISDIETEGEIIIESHTDCSEGVTVGMPEVIIVEPEIIDTFKTETLKPMMLGKMVKENSIIEDRHIKD
jgi:hypothetical protein